MSIFGKQVSDEDWSKQVLPLYQTAEPLVSRLCRANEGQATDDLAEAVQDVLARLPAVAEATEGLPNPQSAEAKSASSHFRLALKDCLQGAKYAETMYRDLAGGPGRRMQYEPGMAQRAAAGRISGSKHWSEVFAKSAAEHMKLATDYLSIQAVHLFMTERESRPPSQGPREKTQVQTSTSEAAVAYCTKCGRKNDSHANYCRDCGMPIVRTTGVQQQEEVTGGPLTMTVTMHANAVESPAQAKPDEPKVESAKEAKPQSSIEEICRGFYDPYLFKCIILDNIDGWESFLDSTFKLVAEADRTFANVDRSQFRNEMTALRMELFLLALSHKFGGDDTAVTALHFTKRYLEEMGRLNIYELMSTYNEMLSESTVRDKYEQRPKGSKAEALFASANKTRLDWYYAWIEANMREEVIKNPPDMTDEEKELLDCAGHVSNYMGVDIRKNDYVAVKLLSYRLAVHLNLEQPKLKRKALQQLQAAIYGYYLGAEEYLSNPERYQRTPSA